MTSRLRKLSLHIVLCNIRHVDGPKTNMADYGRAWVELHVIETGPQWNVMFTSPGSRSLSPRAAMGNAPVSLVRFSWRRAMRELWNPGDMFTGYHKSFLQRNSFQRVSLRISGVHLNLHSWKQKNSGNITQQPELVYTTQVNSAFRAIWLVPQARDIKCYSPPGGFRRKKWRARPISSENKATIWELLLNFCCIY